MHDAQYTCAAPLCNCVAALSPCVHLMVVHPFQQYAGRMIPCMAPILRTTPGILQVRTSARGVCWVPRAPVVVYTLLPCISSPVTTSSLCANASESIAVCRAVAACVSLCWCVTVCAIFYSWLQICAPHTPAMRCANHCKEQVCTHSPPTNPLTDALTHSHEHCYG